MGCAHLDRGLRAELLVEFCSAVCISFSSDRATVTFTCRECGRQLRHTSYPKSGDWAFWEQLEEWKWDGVLAHPPKVAA
jgi:hypothetical protein